MYLLISNVCYCFDTIFLNKIVYLYKIMFDTIIKTNYLLQN
jgi:hypothetical protein